MICIIHGSDNGPTFGMDAGHKGKNETQNDQQNLKISFKEIEVLRKYMGWKRPTSYEDEG